MYISDGLSFNKIIDNKILGTARPCASFSSSLRSHFAPWPAYQPPMREIVRNTCCPPYMYCLKGRTWGYTGTCQFSTYGQCMATASGTGGYCHLNPAYAFAQHRWQQR
ncbi:DUF3551 domain-containing protein [Bradyrhizobium japonicum]|uniref:DUF3551 domain-containing protein n=1 Tax=Bradyrhizobium japonicum TaxID=375 RepID=UPI003F666DEA